MLVLVIIVLITLLTIHLYHKYTNYTKLNITYEKNSNDEPVYIDHMHEFDIKDSNYLEKYYERYVSYKKKHSNYSDDKIITYVNIGLDYEFYTHMEDTDMSDGYLIICNKYHKLKSNYVPD